MLNLVCTMVTEEGSLCLLLVEIFCEYCNFWKSISFFGKRVLYHVNGIFYAVTPNGTLMLNKFSNLLPMGIRLTH